MIRRRDRRGMGAAIIEFALLLPMLVVLILSMIDFGLYFFIDHTIQFATREGVRLALIERTVSDAFGNPLNREASIARIIRDQAAIAIDPRQLQINILPVAANGEDPAGYMRVTTRYSYAFVTPLFGALVSGGRLPVKAQATYRI